VDGLKIEINMDETIGETKITIDCNRITPQIEKLISTIRLMNSKLTGVKENQTYIMDVTKILYIDTVDKKTFLYTKSDIYESSLKLYELEGQLYSNDFLRANKSCIINFNQIQSLKADLDGKLLVTMMNGEKLFVSRQYAPTFKEKLGV
jgi:Response regulator of the LytR/AlgR family